MAKIYKDRAMQVEGSDIGKGQSAFFFPKNNPPVTIIAKTIEEAEELLAKQFNK
jgi:hypothetical protein